MASDSEGKNRKDAGVRARPEPPIIDLAATEVTPAAPVEAEAAPVASEAPVAEAAVPEEMAVEAPAAETPAAETVPEAASSEATDVAPAPDSPAGSGSDEASAPGSGEPDDTALLSEVPPSGESGTASREGGNGSSITRLVASAVLGAAVTLMVTGGALYSLGWLPPAAVPAPAATPAGVAVDLSTLQGRVDELAARLDKAAGAPPSDAALADRVTALEDEMKALPAATAAPEETTRFAADLAALAKRVDGLAGSIDPAAVAALKTAAADLGGRLRALEALVSSLAAARETAGAELRTLTGRADAIEKRLDAGPKGGEIAALSLATIGLTSKVAAGLPFSADLELVRAAAPDLPGLDGLAALAPAGVPTLSELSASLPVEAMLARRPVDVDKGWAAGLMESAKSLVNYRETGRASEDPASRAIAGIRAGLAAGDTAAAEGAAAGLPDWARAGAGDWLARLDARAKADAAVNALAARIAERLRAPAEGK